jgi:hypothetical protein
MKNDNTKKKFETLFVSNLKSLLLQNFFSQRACFFLFLRRVGAFFDLCIELNTKKNA